MSEALWRWVEARLRRRLPPSRAASTLGDLAEDFTQRRAAVGSLRASVWLIAEARSLRRAYRSAARDALPASPGGWRQTLDDLRQARTRLLARPAMPLLCAALLALGIGLSTAMFSVVDSLLLRPAPFPDADRLVQQWLWRTEPDVMDAWRASGAFDAVEAAHLRPFEISTGGEVFTGAFITPGVFDLLGARRAGTAARPRRCAPGIAQVSQALVPGDRASVVLFGGRVAERSPLRPPPIVADLTAIGTGTSIYDALLLSLVTAPVPDRRQLTILMTDGDDTTSVFDVRTALDTARYAAGQLSFVVVQGRGMSADGAILSAFRTIAQTTGGELLQIDDDDRLSDAFLRALANFRLSYVIRYTPTEVPAAGWHDVDVRVTSERYAVRARRGYWRQP